MVEDGLEDECRESGALRSDGYDALEFLALVLSFT